MAPANQAADAKAAKAEKARLMRQDRAGCNVSALGRLHVSMRNVRVRVSRPGIVLKSGRHSSAHLTAPRAHIDMYARTCT